MRFPTITDELLARHDVPGPRYTSYPTVPAWQEITAADYAAGLERAASTPAEPLSLYVHLPFCERRCTYCGCNVVITEDRSKADRYIDHLDTELEQVAARLGDRTGLTQLHWGGGTPTFLDLEQIERVWTMITKRFAVLDDAEVAIEIDPSVTTADQIRLLRKLGFNRVSFGVQDFDPRVQETVNRVQSVERTAELYELARELGFTGINFDLIYGLPHQSRESWGKTLQTVAQMRPDRLAVYSFAYLPDRQKQQRKLPVAGIPTGRDKLSLFSDAYDAFLEAGYETIGMDHFALPDDELAMAKAERRLGRNFQGYTVRAAEDSVAFGISGIGRIGGMFAQNQRGLTHYYDRLDAGHLAAMKGKRLTEDDEVRARIITSLMCNNWVDLSEYPGDYSAELDGMKPFEDDGFVQVDGSTIELTQLGSILMRRVASVFDAYLDTATKNATFSRTV